MPLKSVKINQSTKKCKVVFGVSVKRFLGFGFHPGLDPDGLYKNKNNICPGDYDVAPKPRKPDERNWYSKQLDAEKFSKSVVEQYPRRILEARVQHERGSPGDYDLKSSIATNYVSVKNDLGFGRAERFKTKAKNPTPGPGNYGKYHIPNTLYDEAYNPCNTFTNVPSMEWDGFVSRFKNPRMSLPPNRYNPKDPYAIATRLPEKVVSKRGPYDLFTGPRDETTMKNYFAPSTFKGSKTFFQTFPSYMDRLKDPLKANNGKFSMTVRWGGRPCSRMMIHDLSLCYKDPNSPSPDQYNNQLKSKICYKKNKYAFNMSSEEPRHEFKKPMIPGPGRYAQHIVKQKKPVHRSWQFKSKTQRGFKPPAEHNSF